MTVYLVYYDAARVGRRWLGRTRGHWSWGNRDAATRFRSRRDAETVLRTARRHTAGVEEAHERS